jgi:C-terminal processing protease CtpA/Prc
LGRFLQPLHDGHAWVRAYDRNARAAGIAPLDVDFVGQPRKLVVFESDAPGIERGDEIVAIGGKPVAELLEAALARISAGSELTKLAVAAGKLLELDGPTVFAVRRPGVEDTVEVKPGQARPGSRFLRGAGPLPSDLYYVNLDADVTKTMDIAAVTTAAHASKGIVLDMRGYPGPESWAFIANIFPGTVRGPKLLIPRFTRKGERERSELTQTLGTFGKGSHAPYAGPIVVLVGPHSQSQSEHMISFLIDGKAKLVGRPTSGANGNITGAQLAGGFAVTFTGMEVRHTDGRRFHGIGHIPDVPVEPTLEDLRANKDTVLEAGIATLLGR